MYSVKKLKYLSELPDARVQEWVNNQQLMELEPLCLDIQAFLSSDTSSQEAKARLLIAQSYAEARINGLKQESGETFSLDEEFIDISEFRQLTSKDLIEVLGLTIKKDDQNKLITFQCMLSAYTQDSQFNLSYNAPSSSGKSYIPTEVATLFPQEDIIEVGYCSPTAFFHDKSKEYKKETNELVIDLSHKIMIFLDQPHTLLLQHLRPILSHDKKEIRIKITDKSQKAGLRTKNIFIRGYPSVIFCTAGLHIDEQESTRFILLSPEINQEKIGQAIKEKIIRASDSLSYQMQLEKNPARKSLQMRIRAIKQEKILEIIIKDPSKIEQLFTQRIKIYKPRHQRDISRVISLIKVFALLNVWFRERSGTSIFVSNEDIVEGFLLYDAISESQELNIPPYVFDLYKRVILPIFQDKNPDGIVDDIT